LYILSVDFVVYRSPGPKTSNPVRARYAIYKFYGVVIALRNRVYYVRTGVMVARDLRHVTADANENVGVAWDECVTWGWLFSSRERDYCGLCTTIRVCDRNIGI